jgi:hypothetical protein
MGLLTAKLILVAALAAGSLSGGPAAKAADHAGSVAQAQSPPAKECPSPGQLEAVLAQASERLGESRFEDAAGMLQSVAKNCDARISLLLAVAFEGQRDIPKATEELQQAQRL